MRRNVEMQLIVREKLFVVANKKQKKQKGNQVGILGNGHKDTQSGRSGREWVVQQREKTLQAFRLT